MERRESDPPWNRVFSEALHVALLPARPRQRVGLWTTGLSSSNVKLDRGANTARPPSLKPVQIQNREVDRIDQAVAIDVEKGICCEPFRIHDAPIDRIHNTITIEIPLDPWPLISSLYGPSAHGSLARHRISVIETACTIRNEIIHRRPSRCRAWWLCEQPDAQGRCKSHPSNSECRPLWDCAIANRSESCGLGWY